MQPREIRVFDGLRITTEHVDHLQGAVQTALRDLRAIAGPGVHRGLEVAVGEAGAVTVGAGFAIDAAGNRLVRDEPLTVDVGPLDEGEMRIVALFYRRVETGEVEGRATLVWDDSTARVLDAAAPPPEDAVVLARVAGGAGGTIAVVDEAAVPDVPPAPAAAPGAGAPRLSVGQGMLRLGGGEDLLPRLVAAIRARPVAGDPVVVPLGRRLVRPEPETAALSCASLLSAAFAPARPDVGEPAARRLHATASAEVSVGPDGIAQWALCRTEETDGGASRPTLAPGVVASLEPALLAGAAPGDGGGDGEPFARFLAALELRARIGREEEMIVLLAEAVWSGAVGEEAARAVEDVFAAATFELGFAWKAHWVSWNGPGNGSATDATGGDDG